MLKKSGLWAIGLLVAQGAAAQSSLTLFGVVDASVIYTKGSGPGSASRTQLGNSGNQFSRLGFRGTEDLGGGLAASFWLEAGLQNDNGSSFATNTNNQASGAAGQGQSAFTFGRRSTVSLSGPFGELRLGRDYTPSFWALALFDSFGTGGGIGANQIYFSALSGIAAPTGTRASNSIGYFLPGNLGGFYGQAMVATGENLSNAVAGGSSISRDGRYAGVRLGYQRGGWNTAVAAGQTDYATGDLKSANLGLAYTFGPELGHLKLVSHVHKESLGSIDGKGYLVGFQWPFGPGEFKGSFARYSREAPGLPDPTVEKLSFGYVHNLSKRTALYGTVARLRNSNGSSQALSGAVTAPDQGSSGVELGLRHAF